MMNKIKPIKQITKFADLLEEIVDYIDKINGVDGDELIFTLRNGRKFKLFHEQACCERVYIEDIDGNIYDLIGNTLIQCEEVSSYKEDIDKASELYVPDEDSYKWTFYKMATIRGHVTIRWYGSSNGYYSESVDFKEIL